MPYRDQFPDIDPATMPAIPADFADASWRNDTCPCFVSDTLGLELWIDYADPHAREFSESRRFSVRPQEHGIEVSGETLETDDWNEVLAFVDRTRAEVQSRCQHRDTGRGVCADCGAFLHTRD